MHIYYVYIIECNDGTLYVGVTNDVERRFWEHCEGLNHKSYTAKRRPLKLVHVETFQWILDAIAREKQLKGWSAPKKRALMMVKKKPCTYSHGAEMEQSMIARNVNVLWMIRPMLRAKARNNSSRASQSGYG